MRPPAPPRAAAFRPEIQILRAAAVGAVVLYHLWPHRLPGGFVGVDIFFVISGYLISAHLLREVRATGRISLPSFWARRARRLLPVSLLVLVVTALATLAWVPRVYWQQTFREIVGSSVYIQNWVLAGDSIDYLAAQNVASPVQHFWSLSVEEQFYFVWPVLFLGAVLVSVARTGSGRHSDPRRNERALVRSVGAVIAAVALLSLAYSVSLTATSPGPAYFATTTRAWEFAAGGLLAVLAWRPQRAARRATFQRPASTRPRTLASWAGWALLAVSLVAISGNTPYPGIAALLPVVATLLIIGAGAPASRWAPHRILGIAPVLRLGDLSYSVYLWHWPILTILGFQLGASYTWPVKAATILGVLGLSWVTYRFVETPFRRLPVLARARPRRTFVALAVAIVVIATPVSTGGILLQNATASELEAAENAASSGRPCFGAAALASGSDCPPDPGVPLLPDPAAASSDQPPAERNGCLVALADPDLRPCSFGTGETRVALIGDSHAASWEPAARILAKTNGWTVTTFFHEACPQTAARPASGTPAFRTACVDWNDSLADALAAAPRFDAVVVAHSQNRTLYESEEAEISGFRAAWTPLLERKTPIVVIRDVPHLSAEPNLCLTSTPSDRLAECAVPRSVAVDRQDPMVTAAEGVAGVSVVDLNDHLCTATTCAPAIGGVTVYRDTDHLSATFSTTMAPFLGRALGTATAALR